MTLEKQLEALYDLIEAIQNTMNQIDGICDKLDREINENIHETEKAIEIVSKLVKDKAARHD